jgi:heme/copper-type cytochrome/quinol oxidase subunit 2
MLAMGAVYHRPARSSIAVGPRNRVMMARVLLHSQSRSGSSLLSRRGGGALLLGVALSGACSAPGLLRTEAVEVEVLAHDTSWTARLLGALEGGAKVKLEAGREVHVPLGAEVTLALSSRDYICLFALPELGVRDFAAPGLPARFTFAASREGRFALRGDELCGLPHGEATRGLLVVESAELFQRWASGRGGVR